MPEPFLIDTDVMIDYLRGRPEALSWMSGLLRRPLISVVTVAELYAGVREGLERMELDDFLTGCEMVNLDPEVAIKGGLYSRAYKKSHNVGLNDALIAATAEMRGVALVTFNLKHYPMLTSLFAPYTKI